MSLKRPIRRFPRCHFHNFTNTSNKSWMSECTIELALSRRQFLYLQLINVQLPSSINIWTVKQPCGYYHLPTKLGKVLFSVLSVCSQWGTEEIHLTITYDALGLTLLSPPRDGASLYMTHLKMGPHCWCTPTPDMKPDCAGPPRLGTTLYRILHPDIKTHWNFSSPMGFPCPRAEIWLLRSEVGRTHPTGMFYSSLRQIHKYTQTIFITTFIMKKTNKLFEKGVKNVN